MCRRTKVILHALVSIFEFALAVAVEDIGKKDGIVARPILKSAREKGPQLPLRVTRASDVALI